MDKAVLEIDDSRGEAAGAFQLVRREDDGDSGCVGVTQDAVEQILRCCIETGMGFIEQPQFATLGNQTRKGDATTLTSAQTRRTNVQQTRLKPYPFERVCGKALRTACGARSKGDVFCHRQFVVKAVGVGKVSKSRACIAQTRSIVGA